MIPGLGRSPGEENGNPLQFSCLGTPLDRGAWWATVHGVAKRVRHDLVTKQQKQMIISETPQHLCAHLMKSKFPASSLLLEVCYQINMCLTIRNVRHDISVGVSSLDLLFPTVVNSELEPLS